MLLCILSYNHIMFEAERVYHLHELSWRMPIANAKRTQNSEISFWQTVWLGDIGTAPRYTTPTAIHIQLVQFKQRRAAAGTTRQQNLTQSVQFMLLNGRPKFILNDLSGHGRALVYKSTKPICTGHIVYHLTYYDSTITWRYYTYVHNIYNNNTIQI